jgi:putative nucleotidyltransferase with HDIG domain
VAQLLKITPCVEEGMTNAFTWRMGIGYNIAVNAKPTGKNIQDRVVERIARLPALPENIHELRQAIANPDVSFKDVVPILNKDAGLTADLLKLVNSSRYGLRERIGTVKQAVLFFGMRNLIDYVALTFAEKSLRMAFSRIPNISSYFQHAAEIATQTRRIATMAGIPVNDQEVLTMAGLLHDVGRLVLYLETQAGGMSLLGGNATEDMESVVLLEQDMWGIDHCDIGARICRKWRFPELFETCIRWHHKPVHDDLFSREGAIILLAHILTIPGISAEIIATALPPDRMSELNLDPENLSTLAVACRSTVA